MSDIKIPPSGRIQVFAEFYIEIPYRDQDEYDELLSRVTKYSDWLVPIGMRMIFVDAQYTSTPGQGILATIEYEMEYNLSDVNQSELEDYIKNRTILCYDNCKFVSPCKIQIRVNYKDGKWRVIYDSH
jgi:hypothetical protein